MFAFVTSECWYPGLFPAVTRDHGAGPRHGGTDRASTTSGASGAAKGDLLPDGRISPRTTPRVEPGPAPRASGSGTPIPAARRSPPERGLRATHRRGSDPGPTGWQHARRRAPASLPSATADRRGSDRYARPPAARSRRPDKVVQSARAWTRFRRHSGALHPVALTVSRPPASTPDTYATAEGDRHRHDRRKRAREHGGVPSVRRRPLPAPGAGLARTRFLARQPPGSAILARCRTVVE